MNRIDQKLAALREAGRSGLAAYCTAGDPDYATCLQALRGLPGAGADFIELGMPFSDPVADGPVLQRANLRALAAGQTMSKTFTLVEDFRRQDEVTPIVLMGYFNPILRRGIAAFVAGAQSAGVDGLIVVDLPPEQAGLLGHTLREHGLHLIRMTAPTSDESRLKCILEGASGFVYHVMIAGTTGAAAPDGAMNGAVVGAALQAVRAQTALPIAAGFGVRTPAQARAAADHAELVAVGTRLVEELDRGGVPAFLAIVGELSEAIRR